MLDIELVTLEDLLTLRMLDKDHQGEVPIKDIENGENSKYFSGLISIIGEPAFDVFNTIIKLDNHDILMFLKGVMDVKIAILKTTEEKPND